LIDNLNNEMAGLIPMALKRRLLLGFLVAGTAALAMTIPACRSSAPADKVVNLYTARHYEADNQVYAGFLKKTGIKVNLVEAPADKLIERIQSEGQNSPADVIVTVDAGNLVNSKNANLFQKLDDGQLNGLVPANYRDNEGYWYGFTRRSRVILYNKALFKNAPEVIKTYEDLASDAVKADGRKGLLVRSSGNVYNQSLVASILNTHGEEKTLAWAKGVVKNMARQPEGNDTAQLKALAAGVGELAISNTYYLARLAKSSNPEEKEIASKIGVIFPNQTGDPKAQGRGSHFNISGGGIAKNAPNRDHAIAFLQYLATPEAQAIFASSNNEYPMIKGVAVDSFLESLGSFKEDVQNDAVTFGRKNGDALKVMNQADWK
jgi:iron(III) transport system substrate-binding protein